MTTPPVLPPRRPDDVRGLLTFSEPLPDDLQRAEDSTQENDYQLRDRTRLATHTERTLLEAIGYVLPADLVTKVEFLSGTLRRREWPQLNGQQPTESTP